jgi:hypothetical protein
MLGRGPSRLPDKRAAGYFCLAARGCSTVETSHPPPARACSGGCGYIGSTIRRGGQLSRSGSDRGAHGQPAGCSHPPVAGRGGGRGRADHQGRQLRRAESPKAPELFASQVLRLLIRRNVLLCFIAVTPTINYPDSARLRGAGRGLLLVYK